MFGTLLGPETYPRGGGGMTIQRKLRPESGLTVFELLIGIAILGVIAAIAIPSYTETHEKAKITQAIGTIESLELQIISYQLANRRLPNSLEDLRVSDLVDPWGNPYQYLNFATIKGNGKGSMRKDRSLVPLNSTFDLYSMGKDGQSKPPLTAKASHDDIVRAADGAYVGLAANY